MSYNHGKEERKCQHWKLAEEKVLRVCGMDESTIEQLRHWDRAMFNSDRRFYEKLQDTGTCLDSIAGSEASTEIYTVEDLLNVSTSSCVRHSSSLMLSGLPAGHTGLV